MSSPTQAIFAFTRYNQFMFKKVKAFCEIEKLLSVNDQIVIAVSGGVDSMVLLEMLFQFQKELNLQLHVAHLNHQLRPDSEVDANFVVEQAKQRGLAFTLEKVNVAEYASKNKQSIETAGRHARYDFLKRVAQAHHYGKIALAHHQNDQAETFFLNVIRGATAQGWGGMKPLSDVYIRPLLNCSKSNIYQFAQDQKIPYREDETNTDQKFRRNWVRQRVIPLLEQKNENLVDAITRNQAVFRQTSDYLQQQAEIVLEHLIISKEKDELSLNRKNFIVQHPAMQTEVIRLVIKNLRGDLNRLEAHHILKLCAHAKSKESGQLIELPLGLMVMIQPDVLIFSSQKIGNKPVPESQKLNISGETQWANWSFISEVKAFQSHQDIGRLSVCMDWSKIEPPLVVRSRQPGDRIDPMGLSGRKKIQDIFMDAKVARTTRDQVPLIEDQKGIVWVVGHCQSERTRVTTASQQVFHIRAVQHE